MLHQYYTIIGCQYEAIANIANGNPILSQCGLTRERQRQWETNAGPKYLCCLGVYHAIVVIIIIIVIDLFRMTVFSDHSR